MKTKPKSILSLLCLLALTLFFTGCGINTTEPTLRNAFLSGKPGTWSYHPNGYDIETGEEYRERRWGHLAWKMKQDQEGNSDYNSPLQRKGKKYERGQSPYERKLRERREESKTIENDDE